jgi:hypothetical protein
MPLVVDAVSWMPSIVDAAQLDALAPAGRTHGPLVYLGKQLLALLHCLVISFSYF